MLAVERANAHRQNNFDGIFTGKIDFNKQDELPRDKLVNLINHFGSQAFDRAHVSECGTHGSTYPHGLSGDMERCYEVRDTNEWLNCGSMRTFRNKRMEVRFGRGSDRYPRISNGRFLISKPPKDL